MHRILAVQFIRLSPLLMTLSDIQQLITLLGSTPDVSGNTYTKVYPRHKNYTLSLDLANRRILYSEPIKVSD